MKSVRCLFVPALVLTLAMSMKQNDEFTTTKHLENNFDGNGFIVFYSGRNGNNDIYRMNSDGTALTQLTTNTADDECPSISTDGSKIAFLSKRDGNSEIYLMNIDGSGQTRITNNSDTEEHPSWSLDGTKIFFMKDFSSRTEIWVMNADGGNAVRLTNNSARDERPVLSPDGQTILFMSNRNGNYEIYMMDTDGSNQRRITNSAGHKIFPMWSPDGAKIAYGLTVMVGGIPQADIHIMSADGSGDTTLTSANGRDENPIWSPNGSSLIFQSERDGNFEVYKMNTDGSNQQRLTNHASWDGWPSWGRDTAQVNINDDDKTRHGFKLRKNYPNPFNPSTTIGFEIPITGHVTLKIYNMLGQEVATLLNREMPKGNHTVQWSGRSFSSGIYFCRMDYNGISETNKLLLAK